jgi:hypothetical protein
MARYGALAIDASAVVIVRERENERAPQRRGEREGRRERERESPSPVTAHTK